MQKRLLIAPLFLLLLVACGGPQVNIMRNGVPQPNEIVSLSNPSGIETTFSFCRTYKESQESFYPQYLPLNKLQKLPKKSTKDVALNLWINNPEKMRFTIIKVLEIDGKSYENNIYKGHQESKLFQLQGPLTPGKTIKISAWVFCEGQRLFLAGDVIYKILK